MVTRDKGISTGGHRIIRDSEASAANTAKTTSTTLLGTARRLLFVTAKYSAVPVQPGVTVTLNSGVGAAFDTLLATGSVDTQDTVYIPDEEVIISDDDVLDVLAPAGGGVITSAVTIYTEVV